MTKPYRVEVADRAGVYAWRDCETFWSMVCAYRQLRRAFSHRDSSFRFSNADAADVDTDGLTERETEILGVIS